MSTGRRWVAAVALAVVASVPAAGDAAPVTEPRWAPAATASVHPGVPTYTDGSKCTSSFVFLDARGAVYLGQAAHCASTSGPTATNGCQAGSLPLGTPVEVDGASRPGVLAYSSWIAMRAKGEKDAGACSSNDFALVRLHPDDVKRTNPSVPSFGGPTGLVEGGLRGGSEVLMYASTVTRERQGVVTGPIDRGWSHRVFTVLPGIPGDSGAGLLFEDGRAFASLSAIEYWGANRVADLARVLSYARAHGVPGLRLVKGTEPYTGPLVG